MSKPKLKINANDTPVLNSTINVGPKNYIPVGLYLSDEWNHDDFSDDNMSEYIRASRAAIIDFGEDLQKVSDKQIMKNLPNIIRSMAKNDALTAINTSNTFAAAYEAKDFIRDEFYSDMKSEDVRKKHEGNFVFTGTGATPFDINK